MRRASALPTAALVAALTVTRFGHGETSAIEAAPAPAPPAPAAPPEPEPVRVTYTAPPGCPDEAAFLSLIRARVGTGWEAPPGVLARTFEVRVASEAAANVARVDYADDAGHPVSRSVSATTCEDVVHGIALVTALAIDARLARKAEAEAPPEPLPPPVFVPPPPVLAASPPIRKEPSGPPLHLDVGAGAALVTGVGLGPAFGHRGFVGAGFEEGPDVRLGVDVVQTRFHAPSDAPGDPSQFVLYAGRLSGCPLALSAGAFRALPCAGVEAGVHRARSLGCSQGKTPDCRQSVEPGSASPAFFSPFLSARGEASLPPVFVEAEVEVRFPIGNHQFKYETTPPASVYEVPWAAFGASLAVGLRL